MRSDLRPSLKKSPARNATFNIKRAPYLEALLDSSPLAMMVLDTKQRVQTCNPAFERLFGYSCAEILGKHINSAMIPAGEFDEPAKIIRCCEDEEIVREERKQRRKDGTILDVRIIRTPLIVKTKRIGSFAIYEDITARSRAENAKRQAEDRFRRIFENAVEGIFQTTPDAAPI